MRLVIGSSQNYFSVIVLIGLILLLGWSCSKNSIEESNSTNGEEQMVLDSIYNFETTLDSIKGQLLSQYNITISLPPNYKTTLDFQNAVDSSNRIYMLSGYTLKDIYKNDTMNIIHLKAGGNINEYVLSGLLHFNPNYLIEIDQENLKKIRKKIQRRGRDYISHGWSSDSIQLIPIFKISELQINPFMNKDEKQEDFQFTNESGVQIIKGRIIDLVDYPPSLSRR